MNRSNCSAISGFWARRAVVLSLTFSYDSKVQIVEFFKNGQDLPLNSEATAYARTSPFGQVQ